MPLRVLADPDHLPALDRRYLLDRPELGTPPGTSTAILSAMRRRADQSGNLTSLATKNKV